MTCIMIFMDVSIELVAQTIHSLLECTSNAATFSHWAQTIWINMTWGSFVAIHIDFSKFSFPV